MKQIYHIGNLPKILQAFAVELKGQMSGQKETEFFEASSVDEFEKKASELEYEITATKDGSTNRYYLVGFYATEPKIITFNNNYTQLKMYFIELSESGFKEWDNKIKYHRNLQLQDAYLRRQK